MKAWIVEDRIGEWMALVHAETSGKARAEVASWYESDFIDLSARRLPRLDNKPITWKNAKDAGFQYTTDVFCDEYLPESQFINDCNCEICKPKKE